MRTFLNIFAGNIAFNKTTTESNQYANRRASNAVDGNTMTTRLDDCATATFDPQTNITWWQLDLGNEYVITSVIIFVSTDGSNGRQQKQRTTRKAHKLWD